jgi:beta-ureidopropionase / N-carbamoyl-L-amino-acid hydrolase
MSLDARFSQRFEALAAIGHNPATGGYNRFAWTSEDADARRWFRGEAEALGLQVELDRNANEWAWWDAGGDRERAIVTGSHLDTVPEGGAYDGALGVVAGLTAIEELQGEGVQPDRPVAVVAFTDEEGARYNTPTLGSSLLTGEVKAADVLDRVDAAGVRLADAVAAAGFDPDAFGADPGLLARVDAYVELHVEQGRGLVFDDAPVGVGEGIWPHGRWRIVLRGEPNHAGTTRMADRRDPMRVLAGLVESARRHAEAHHAVATIGKVAVVPNGANAVPGEVTAWLDARAPDGANLDRLVDLVRADVQQAAEHAGVDWELASESFSPTVVFEPDLRGRIERRLRADGFAAPVLATAAGHDAGALATAVPTAMLFVRNREGASHTPAEHATVADCVAGVRALRGVIEDLV